MNWLEKVLRYSAFAMGVIFVIGCGVKCDPLPPEKPADLGRGRPTYKRATEGIQVQPQQMDEEDEEEDDRDGSEVE